MTSIGFDLGHDDCRRRQNLYGGDLYVFSPRPSTLELIEHARSMIEQAYGAAPTRAQYRMPVEEFSSIGAALKPRFIYHPRTKEVLERAVAEHGGAVDGPLVFTPILHEAAAEMVAGVL